MSVIATAVRHLMAAGVTGDALLSAIGELEAEVRAEPKPRSAGAIRQARYEERKRQKVSEMTALTGNDGNDADPALSLPPNEENNSNPPAHSHPDIKTPRARKGHRLPSDWHPAPLPPELAADVLSWPDGAMERELARFRDWAASATGPNATKSNWDAAWRNWLRKAHDEGRHLKNDRAANQSQAHRGNGVASALDRRIGPVDPPGETERRSTGNGGDDSPLAIARIAVVR